MSINRDGVVSLDGLEEFIAIINSESTASEAINVREFIYSLSGEERGLIRAYYFWLTSRAAKGMSIEDIAQKDEEALAQQREMGAEDWEFIGMSDLLYQGAARCTHGTKSVGSQGHLLRNVYYVYSRKLDKTLQFGVTCASKFLGYDLTRINCSTILDNGKYELARALAYGRNSEAFYNSLPYKIMFTLRRNTVLREKFIKALGKGASELYFNFIYHGLMLPYKLNKLIIDTYVQLTKGMFGVDIATNIAGEASAPNEKYIKFTKDSAYIETLYTRGTYSLYYSDDTTLLDGDTPIPVLLELGSKMAINGVIVNMCLYNIDYLDKNNINYAELLDKLGTINKLIGNYKANNVPTAALLSTYLLDPSANVTPELVLAEAIASDNLNMLTVFFNITSAKQLVNVIYDNYDALITLLQKVVNTNE